MSDQEEAPSKPFCIDRPKQGRAACKKCKEKCLAGELRIGKVAPSAFGSGLMKMWHHVNCMFEVFLKQRATTKRMDSPEDIEGWEELSEEDKDDILQRIQECDKHFGVASSQKKGKTPQKEKKKTDDSGDIGVASTSSSSSGPASKDSYFREFRRLVAEITNESSYLEKTNIVRTLFTKGKDGKGFNSDISLWCRLLLPGSVKRIYNLQSKQLVKLFSKILHVDQDKMLEHLEQGDIGETIQNAFEESNKIVPCKKSLLTLQEVDEFLEELSHLTKEDEQMFHFKKILRKCTGNDLKVIVRLIKHDLRMNAGAKHILEAVHPDAYEAFQASRDINSVIQRALEDSSPGSATKTSPKALKATISLMTPVLPMLAEACKSIDHAMKKCPNGMYSEIKYDGERVQVHKKGSEFKYFSRSLKPVMPHKIKHFKDFIPEAFPHGKDLILDSEILMIDTESGKPLPFGTLGVHKKSEFENANVCLFVFDCIYYNGEVLTTKPIKERKQILKSAMIEIPNRIVFSELEEVHEPGDLATMIAKVLKMGLEGLVLKDMMSVYEPGKRHWLKVKKDYLFGGAMADSADLIVLGAWYGTGKKGGMMSVFLMGCYDRCKRKFCTVTKVHTGHDDATLERLQTELDMVKISGEAEKVPAWLCCTKTMVPDFVARNPEMQPVWEVTGAEFTQIHDVHTADGISVRFPRVTKIRDDKNWETATNLSELNTLFKNSKENMDVGLLMDKLKASSSDISDTAKRSPKKRDSGNLAVKKDRDESFIKRGKPESEGQLSVEKYLKEETDAAFDSITDPLADVFVDVKLLVLDKEFFIVNCRDLIRHFIGYGGVLLPDDRWDEATHVLHKDDCISAQVKDCPLRARHVSGPWLRHCIRDKTLIEPEKYCVKLMP